MENNKNFYITTPLYYVNDKPHIGHAYTSIACDIVARFNRLKGNNTFFLTGTDEHGQKVEKSAKDKGYNNTLDFVNDTSLFFRNMSEDFMLTNNDFIRTSEERHKAFVQQAWQKLIEKGYIYKGKYEGWYALKDEAFYLEKDLSVNEKGEKIAPTGAEVKWLSEESYFFKLSAFEEKLLEIYENNPNFVKPASRLNEVKSFVKSGLKDLSVSRTSFSWGIKVPNDENHVMYVWLDALLNYISVPESIGKTKELWPGINMVGKDIVKFHAVYWPCFLMALDYEIPKQIFAHGWWTNEGQKISKSLGNVIDPYAIKEQYGLDAFRYFMFREMPFGKDGNFSHKAITSRLNNELANEYGNLLQRSVAMIIKHNESKIPACKNSLTDIDLELCNKANALLEKCDGQIKEFDFYNCLISVWAIVKDCNAYFNDMEPWAIVKQDKERFNQIMYCTCYCIKQISLILQAFIPESAEKVLDCLGVDKEERSFADFTKDIENNFVFKPKSPIFTKVISE